MASKLTTQKVVTKAAAVIPTPTNIATTSPPTTPTITATPTTVATTTTKYTTTKVLRIEEQVENVESLQVFGSSLMSFDGASHRIIQESDQDADGTVDDFEAQSFLPVSIAVQVEEPSTVEEFDMPSVWFQALKLAHDGATVSELGLGLPLDHEQIISLQEEIDVIDSDKDGLLSGHELFAYIDANGSERIETQELSSLSSNTESEAWLLQISTAVLQENEVANDFGSLLFTGVKSVDAQDPAPFVSDDNLFESDYEGTIEQYVVESASCCVEGCLYQ